MHYPTVRSMKSLAVLIEDGAFALFFPSPSRGIGSLSVHQEFAIQHIRRITTAKTQICALFLNLFLDGKTFLARFLL